MPEANATCKHYYTIIPVDTPQQVGITIPIIQIRKLPGGINCPSHHFTLLCVGLV